METVDSGALIAANDKRIHELEQLEQLATLDENLFGTETVYDLHTAEGLVKFVWSLGFPGGIERSEAIIRDLNALNHFTIIDVATKLGRPDLAKCRESLTEEMFVTLHETANDLVEAAEESHTSVPTASSKPSPKRKKKGRNRQ